MEETIFLQIEFAHDSKAQYIDTRRKLLTNSPRVFFDDRRHMDAAALCRFAFATVIISISLAAVQRSRPAGRRRSIRDH